MSASIVFGHHNQFRSGSNTGSTDGMCLDTCGPGIEIVVPAPPPNAFVVFFTRRYLDIKWHWKLYLNWYSMLPGPNAIAFGPGVTIVESAVPKLEEVAEKFGITVEELLQRVSKGGQALKDLANKGNINVYLRRPDGAPGFVRLTLDPGKERIVSAGLNQARDVANGIAKGRLVPPE